MKILLFFVSVTVLAQTNTGIRINSTPVQGGTIGNCLTISTARRVGVAACGSGGGATIPSVTNIIKGDGLGNGADAKVAITSPATAATIVFAADNETVTLPNGTLVANGRNVSTTAPLGGGGNLAADLTITCTTCATSSNNLSFFSSTTSAQLLALLTNPTGTGLAVFNNTPTIITPVIASFVNATHNHQAAAGGGTLSEAALALSNVTTNDATTTTHGFAPKGTTGTTQFWRQDWTLAVPPGGGSGCSTSGSVNQILVDNGAGGCTSSSATIDPTAGLAGGISMPQGNPKTPPTSNITVQAPVAVTAYSRVLPGVVGSTGIVHETVSGSTQTETVSQVVNADITNSTIDLTAKVTNTLPVPNGGSGATTLAVHGPLVGEGTSPIVATSPGTSGQCFLSNGASVDPSFQACPGGAGAGNSVTSTTPITVNTNTTADQQLMELSLGAGYFNSSKQPFLFDGAGVYTTQTAQTPTLNLKIKLCTVSGCGSGTVVTLISITSTSTIAAVTNNNWNLAILGYTATTGATGNLEIHGPLAVDLGALTTTADSIFVDTNTAVSSNIDLTAALFVDFTIAFSTNAVTANTFTQRSGGVMPFAATAAPVTSVNGLTGAVTGITQTIFHGTKALATGAISSATCTTAQTVVATGTLTTDIVTASFNGDPTAVTGYVPLTTGMLTIIAYPTADTVNFKVCNNTSSSITPGAITLNVAVNR